MSLRWRGRELVGRAEEAQRRGIDATMAQAVIHAKRNHPGWRNRTSTAEGSIRIQVPARKVGSGFVGLWGSVNVNYMIFLELKHGSALRNAADVTYPNLARNIRRFLGATS